MADDDQFPSFHDPATPPKVRADLSNADLFADQPEEGAAVETVPRSEVSALDRRFPSDLIPDSMLSEIIRNHEQFDHRANEREGHEAYERDHASSRRDRVMSKQGRYANRGFFVDVELRVRETATHAAQFRQMAMALRRTMHRRIAEVVINRALRRLFVLQAEMILRAASAYPARGRELQEEDMMDILETAFLAAGPKVRLPEPVRGARTMPAVTAERETELTEHDRMRNQWGPARP